MLHSGRRSCLGENLAKMELFLFMANLLHRYKIIGIPGEDVMATDVKNASIQINNIRIIKPFKVILKKRFT